MKKTLPLPGRWPALVWTLLLLLGSGRALAQVPNDDCAQAIPVSVTSNCAVPINGTVAGATQSVSPTLSCGVNVPSALDVWYSFVATGTTQQITLAPRFVAIMDIRSGTCAGTSSVFCTSIAANNTAPTQVGGLVNGQTYFIRIYPSAGTPPAGISSTFALCVGAGATAPVNDDCAGAIDVPVQFGGVCTGLVSADNTSATASTGVPAPTCANYAGKDVWFSVIVPSTGGLTVQTVTPLTGNPIQDTGMSIYSGTCGNLTQLGCDDDGAGNTKSLLSFAGRTPGEVLYIRVWAFAGSQVGTVSVCAVALTPTTNDDCAGALLLPVTTGCASPVAGTLAGASQSLPPTANCGVGNAANDIWYSFVATGTTQTVTLTATFSAIVDVRSGTCANSSSVFCGTAFNGQGLTISGLANGQAYFLRLYANGNVTPVNPAFSLCLNPGPTPPPNDECTGAIPVAITTNCLTPVTGTVAAASQSLPPSANCGFTQASAADVWYSFVASGPTQTITVNPRFAAVMEVRSGTCAASTSLFCSTVLTGQGMVTGGLTAGQTYFLRIYATGTVQPLPANATFTLCIADGPPAVPNDECSTAVAVAVVSGCATSTNGSVAGATQSLPPSATCGTGVNTAADVWYSFVATSSTQLITLNSRFQAVLEVRTGTCTTSSPLFCTAVFANQAGGTVLGGFTAGQTYFIRIYANAAVQPLPVNATFSLCLSPAPPAPANDECAGAVPVPVTTTCNAPVLGTVEAASQSLPAASCGLANILAQDVWYSFVASGPTQVVNLNSNFSAVLELRSGACSATASLACYTVFPGGTSGITVGGLTTGQTYFLRIYNNGTLQPTPLNATFGLCINPGPTPPANDECTGAIAVSVSTTCVAPTTGTVAGATQSLPATATCGFTSNAADVWYSFAATSSTHAITLGTGQVNFAVEVRGGSCAATTSIACGASATGGTQPLLVGGLTVGQTYFVRVYALTPAPPTGAAAAFTLCVTTAPSPPANDNCAGALNVPVQVGTACVSQTTTDNTSATASAGAPAPTCANYQGRDVWFQVTVPPSGTLTVRTVVPATGTDIGDTGMSIYSGTCSNLTQVNCDDDGGGNLKSQIALTGRTAGEVLYVRVWGFGGSRVGTVAVCALTPPTCAAPTALAATGVTSTGAQLTWQSGGTPGGTTTYTVEYGVQGFQLGSGTTVAGLPGPPYALTGLMPGTTYCYYVRENCAGGNGTSTFAGPYCFLTLAGPATPPNDEPCGATTLPLTVAGSPAQPVSGTNVGGTTSSQPGIQVPACSPATQPKDVWFALTPGPGVTSVRLTIAGAAAGMVRVFTAPNCASGPFTLVNCLSSGASNTAVGPLTLTGLVPGQRYYVALSGYGNNDTPGAFTISGATVTATHLQAETNSLVVFPNPSNIGQLTLRLGGAPARGQLALLNALGQVVHSQGLPAGTTEHTLSTRGLATGLYTLRVMIGNDVLTRKVVLE